MLDEQILDLPALELGRRIARGDISSVELVRGYLDRIERRNPELFAFVQVSRRRSMLAAYYYDQTRRSPRSPLHGVPTGIKDLNSVRGMFQRGGSASLKWLLSPLDDIIVKRIKAAGMPILGKLTTAELGTMPVTEPPWHPPTRNPIDARFSAGGSSGGSGAAVGSGMLPIAQGSDGAGSVRIPASFCGLVGFKPSRDLAPNPHLYTDRANLSVNGPLARTVEDAAAFTDIIANSKGDMLDACATKPPKLTFRLTTDSGFCPTDPEYAAAAERVAKLLEGMGHTITTQTPWLQATPAEFLPIWQRQTANVPLLTESGLHPFTAWLRQTGKPLKQADVRVLADALKARTAQWFGVDTLWISPTVPGDPPLVGALAALPPETIFDAMAPIGAFTAAFNIGGQPAISLPAGRSRAGLPIGVQIAGSVGSDALVFSVARAIEAALKERQ